MAEIFTWDVAAANNNSAPPNGFPENMEYDEVNNAAREVMAVLARFVQGSLGGTKTTAGTQPAYTLVSGFTLGAYAAGQVFAFVAHATSTGAVTLNVDGLGAGAVSDARGNQLGSGDIVANGVYLAVRTASAFRVLGALTSASIQALASNTFSQAYLAGGTADAITVTTGLFTAYANGQLIAFRAANNNTGACTINIDGLGAEALEDATSQALASGDIVAPRIYLCGRTNGEWRVLTSLPVDLATQVSGILAVANGGSGRADATAYGVICGGTTSTGAHQSVSVGTSGHMLTSNGAGALPSFQNYAGVNRQAFTASGTWNKPSGFHADSPVQILGGGGGGGGARGGSGNGAGGGAGGGHNEIWVRLGDLGSTETVTIGSGGAGATADGTSGSAGGTSFFGSHMSVFGGGAGSFNGGTDGGGGGGGGGATSAGGNGDGSGNGGDGGGPNGAAGGSVNGSGGSSNSGWGGGGGGGGNDSGGGTSAGSSYAGGGGGGGASNAAGNGGAGGSSIKGGGGGGGGSDGGSGGAAGTSFMGGNGGAGATGAVAGGNGSQSTRGGGGGGGGGAEAANGGTGGAGHIIVNVYKLST